LGKGRYFRFSREMGRNESHSINRASPVSDGEDRLGVEAVRLSPTPPRARDTFGRVHKDAIEVEEQSATGGARHGQEVDVAA